ncbi:MAG: cryptochrome/photolyase family protein [Acidimicrobiia bacterium]
MDTVWVLGDQLHRSSGALAAAQPESSRVLMVESAAKIASKPFHRQRLHFIITAMRRFAIELEDEGFTVDYRVETDLTAGLAGHLRDYTPGTLWAAEPASRTAKALLRSLGVEFVRDDRFLCHSDDFATWAGGRTRLRLEDFYRWQRRRLGYLMDGDQPAGGRWNYDADNREPPPAGGGEWPEPIIDTLDELDREVIAALPATATGAAPYGLWATDRAGALRRLNHFVGAVLPHFGTYEDAMLSGDWHLAHSLLSPYLNLGLLLPGEVCDAVEAAYRQGRVPISSAEGFIRQVIGWREFVWGIYWLWPEHSDGNVLGNDRPLPPAFTGIAATEMRCVAGTLSDLSGHAWTHHIPRLMILANLANLVGVRPPDMVDWMWTQYVDGAEWVMVPNVIGMGMWADGGAMATKPYVSGGAYINRMSDYCRDCRFNPRLRIGDTACPFTSLYWDFIARHSEVLGSNPRMARAVRSFERLSDGEGTRARAAEVINRLMAGTL